MKNSFTPELYEYARNIAKAEHITLKLLREKTAGLPGSHMQISPDQGQFMAMLAKLINAKKYLEVGVFTGYSALAVTLAMIDDNAQTFALDIDPETMKIGQEFWQLAGVNNKIRPIIGDAVASLDKLVNDGHCNTFDIAFIDAQKSDYIAYFERCYLLVKSGGIILVDNIFMNSGVLEQKPKQSAAAVDEFNHYLKNRDLDYCVTTIADGLTIVRKI